jgi:hypothetical protein
MPCESGGAMATPTPEVSLWATLLPVIVGGLIGLTGGLAGPWFLETRKQAAEKKKKRAEKFEELIAAIHEHSHWLDTARSVRVLGSEKELGVNPITKALAIVAIYFPQFYDEMKEVDLAARHFESWMFEAGQKRLDGAKDFRDGHIEAYDSYARNRLSILDDLRKFASEEFQ